MTPLPNAIHRSYFWLSAAVALLLFFVAIVVTASGSRSSATSIESKTAVTEDVEETVTLTPPPDGTKSWDWHTCYGKTGPFCTIDLSYCTKSPDVNSPGTTLIGYVHSYDNGGLFGCASRDTHIYRGAIWFDLSAIIAKAPVVFVGAGKATLKFKKSATDAKDGDGHAISRNCHDQILVATTDWMKGDTAGLELPPGVDSDPIAFSCGSGGCGADVSSIVNNWIKGSEDRFGLVMKSEEEGTVEGKEPSDNAVCQTRYGEFSLTISYRYNKPSLLIVPPPAQGPPTILVSPALTRVNVASAASGATATASSTMAGPFSPGAVIDGERRAVTFLTGGGWISKAPTNDDWLQVDFKAESAINQIDVFMVKDDYTNPDEPVLNDTKFTKYGLIDFAVQYWNDSSATWVNVPAVGNPAKDNYSVWRRFKFPALKTRRIRVAVSKTPDGYSRLAEVEVRGE